MMESAQGEVTAVSIHAPHARRDVYRIRGGHVRRRFNPRASREARLVSLTRAMHLLVFQSTRLTRGATLSPQGWIRLLSSFNPRASREARLGDPYLSPLLIGFNPRASREARRHTFFSSLIIYLFQSTRLTRGATSNGSGSYAAYEFQSTRLTRGATLRRFGARNCD